MKSSTILTEKNNKTKYMAYETLDLIVIKKIDVMYTIIHAKPNTPNLR